MEGAVPSAASRPRGMGSGQGGTASRWGEVHPRPRLSGRCTARQGKQLEPTGPQARGVQGLTRHGRHPRQHGLCGVQVLGARVAVQLVLQRVLDLGLEILGDVVAAGWGWWGRGGGGDDWVMAWGGTCVCAQVGLGRWGW